MPTQRWAARTRGRVLRAPDWLAYATAVLEERGVAVELYDFPAMGWDKVKFTELIKEKHPEGDLDSLLQRGTIWT